MTLYAAVHVCIFLLLPVTQVYSTFTCSHSFCLTQASDKRLLIACTRKGTRKGEGRRNWACVRSECNAKKYLSPSFPPSRISSFPPLSAPATKANLLREFLLHTCVVVLTQSFIYMHTCSLDQVPFYVILHDQATEPCFLEKNLDM